MANQDRVDHKFNFLDQEIELTGKVMPNGEKRIRLRFPAATVHLTIAGNEGGWQEAHYHLGLTEKQVVLKGRMAIVSLTKGVRKIRFYKPNGSYTSHPGDVHNVYLFPGSVTITFSYGEPIANPERKGNDWYAADESFNQWSKSLSWKNVEKGKRE